MKFYQDEPTYILFASEDDINDYIADRNVEDFEGKHETLVVVDRNDLFRALELTKRYGDYCSINKEEYNRIEEL